MRPLLFAPAALLLAAAAFAQSAPPVPTTQCGADSAAFSVQLPQTVLANGQPLAAGSYQVRITAERPAPAVGQSPAGECWIEFVQDHAVVGKEMASVVPAADIDAVAKGPAPRPSAARVDLLKGGEYLRVWLNDAGTHYLVNMPVERVVRDERR